MGGYLKKEVRPGKRGKDILPDGKNKNLPPGVSFRESSNAQMLHAVAQRLRAQAKARQRATQNNDAGRAVKERIPEQDKGQFRDALARLVGCNPRGMIGLSIPKRRTALAKVERARKAGKAGGRHHPKKVSSEAAPAPKLKERARRAVAKEAKISERKLRQCRAVKKADPRLTPARPSVAPRHAGSAPTKFRRAPAAPRGTGESPA
jgi:hypothetical protein